MTFETMMVEVRTAVVMVLLVFGWEYNGGSIHLFLSYEA
jgi:hypothetical protein